MEQPARIVLDVGFFILALSALAACVWVVVIRRWARPLQTAPDRGCATGRCAWRSGPDGPRTICASIGVIKITGAQFVRTVTTPAALGGHAFC